MAVLSANTLLRSAMTASGGNALIGFYLATLAVNGQAVDAALVGLLNATLEIASLVTAVPFGTLIDRYSPRQVLIFGAIMGAIATQLFGISSAIPVFFVARALEGIASAAGVPSILAHLTDVTTLAPEKRGRIMSYFEISLFMGVALGSLLGGPLWEKFGTGAFSILAVGYLLAGIAFSWGAVSVEQTRPKSKSALDGFRAALSDPFLRRLALPWLAFNSMVGLWSAHLAFQLTGPVSEGQYLVGRFSPTEVGIYGFLWLLIFASGVYVWGGRIGRISRVKIMRYSYIGIFLSTIFFLLLNYSLTWSPFARGALIFAYAGSIFIQSGFPPAALAYLTEVAGNSAGRGTAMGLYTLLFSLGNIVGALIGGYLATRWAVNGLLLGSFLFATVGFFSLRLLPQKTISQKP